MFHAIAQRRGATAETWDFYAQAHAPLLEGVDAALDAASAFGAAVLVASPMLTARERERAVTFAARGVLALATLHPLADRRVARAAAALSSGGGAAGASVVDAAGAVEAWLHAITRGTAEGLRPEVVADAACCCFEALGALLARGGAGRHAARVLGDALAVLRDREAERRPHGLQVVVACAELVRACCAAEATVAVAMATDLFREICALAADETPRGAPRPARARLAAALMALAGAAPVREESAARAALRRFRQKRAAARAFAGDVHIRALLDELAGGADEQAREKRQRVQAARAGLHRALAEDAGRAASDDADDAELDEAARRDGAAGWDPPRARLLAHALCAALAADPAGAGPEAAVASRLLVALARLARRVDDAAARAPKAAERVVAALVDGVDTLDALCRAVVASSRALAKGDAHHAEPLVCEASAATLEVLARHAPLRVLACGAATQAFASLAERCAHPGLRAARRSLLDLLWFGVACAPSVAEKHALVDALPPTGEAMAALERLALGDEEAEADDALKTQAANLLYWLAYTSRRHLAACPGVGEKRSRAPSGLVELCARALVAGRDAAAPVALHVLAKATAADPRGARLVADRRAACAERCGPLLAAMLLGRRGEHLRGPAADVLLNVSAERRACRRVAHCALDPLLALAEDPEVDPECASHTDVLLANLGRDAETRNLIHVRRLQLDNARADRVGRRPSASAPKAVKAGTVSASLASAPFAKRVASDPTSLVGSAPPLVGPDADAPRDHAARDAPRTLRGRLRDERVGRHLAAARSPDAALARPPDDARAVPALATGTDTSSAARHAPRRAGFAEGRADPTTWSPRTERLGRGTVGEKSVVLAPTCGAQLSFSFPSAARAPAHHKPASRLFAFKSVRGAKMRDMFPTFEFPSSRGRGGGDDEYDDAASDWHLCHEDRYRPPIVDPGPWPAVTKAPRWAPDRSPESLLGTLGAPEPPTLDWDARLTDCVAAPTCQRHYLPSFTSREVDYDRARRSWGELDDFALLIRATLVAKPKPKVASPVAKVAKSAWKLETSIFAPRRREADCRGFWHSNKFMKRLLSGDWTRLSALPRFENLMKRFGGAAAERALLGGLEKMYRKLLSAFDYYCIVTELDPMDMAMGSWLEFCTDLNLRGEAPGQVSDQTLQGIFVQVNVEVGQARELAQANDNNSLMRLAARRSNCAAAFHGVPSDGVDGLRCRTI